jgi:large subunit ribosomal protein L10
MSNRAQIQAVKQSKIDTLTEELTVSDAIFFTEYRGLTVSQIQTLRSALRPLDASYIVMKNSLIKRTLSGLNMDFPDSVLAGPTALVVSKKECPQVASEVYKFLSSNEALVVKGGYLDGAFLSGNDVKALSKLPSKQVLLGQFVGGLQSVISRFVMGVGSPLRGLVYSLEAIKNKKLGGKNV